MTFERVNSTERILHVSDLIAFLYSMLFSPFFFFSFSRLKVTSKTSKCLEKEETRKILTEETPQLFSTRLQSTQRNRGNSVSARPTDDKKLVQQNRDPAWFSFVTDVGPDGIDMALSCFSFRDDVKVSHLHTHTLSLSLSLRERESERERGLCTAHWQQQHLPGGMQSTWHNFSPDFTEKWRLIMLPCHCSKQVLYAIKMPPPPPTTTKTTTTTNKQKLASRPL